MDQDIIEIIRKNVEPFYVSRPWHDMKHIDNMLIGLEKLVTASQEEKEDIQLAILFHDVIYDTKKTDNEEKSAEFMRKHFEPYEGMLSKERLEHIEELILSTKNHSNKTTIVCLDLEILAAQFSELIEWEHEIFKEYQWAPINKYVNGRVNFLSKYVNRPNDDGSKDSRIANLIQYVENRKYKIGIYPGSFNPFHVGHLDILKQAEEIFDKVIVARGINPDKNKPECPLPESITNCLDKDLKWNGAREVVEYGGLVTDLFKNAPSNVEYFLVRGLRNEADVAQEENFRKVVHDIDPSIKFAYFFSELSHISSSMIRGLMPFDKEVAERYIVK